MKTSFIPLSVFSLINLLSATEEVTLDLAQTLQLVDERNTELAIAVEKMQQAEIASKQAWYQWLPTVRAGFAYAEQKGPLQHTDGTISHVERTSESSGLGVAYTGSGLPAQPGISLEINLVDAIYAPRIATQNKRAAMADKEETRFLKMMDAVEGYYHFVLSAKSVDLHELALEEATALAQMTGEFAKAGEGLEADADRAAVEQTMRMFRLQNARYQKISASGKLASLLKFPSYQHLKMESSALVPLTIYPEEPDVEETISLALNNRPVIEAVSARLAASQITAQREQRAPLIPKLGAGYSYGEFGDEGDFSSGRYGEREDTFVYLYWSLDNLGFGNQAAVQLKQSAARQMELELEQVQVNVSIRIQTAIAELETTRSQLSILREGLERARNGYQLSRKRIFENQGLPLEALDAFKSLADIELLYAKTIAKFNTSQLFLLGATGKEISVKAKE
jgi:outer membrane protein TolC